MTKFDPTDESNWSWTAMIYLSDPRKADPAKMRTIIRQPFTDA